MESVSECATILEDIRHLWAAEQSRARDARLALGLRVSDYVRAWLRPAAGLTLRQRLESVPPLTREAAISHVAAAIGVSPCSLNDIVKVAQAASLLFGGAVGALSYRSLRALAPLVERVKDDCGEGMETWRILPNVEAKAVLLARAVAFEGAASEDVRSRVQPLLERKRLLDGEPLEPEPRKPRERTRVTCMDDTAALRMAYAANPRDLADLLLDLIRRSRDPDTVRRLLLERLTATTRREVFSMAGGDA